ncbi:T9SS type A sorting domain-containing protein [Flavobacterium salilacus subsp. salilacus]|uniref:FG-GAP-like repeat-containing protein n=1 Tax=Flavobacterium TaxID=237 RepID=UPI001075884B|nr:MULTISPECIES: FG-GAP-like repeat-containing protein [Flavobacterium]KAF2518483.1 T9SS type A sorting domain-containing protein [Flavobacterium salilacus subsp. salilacus]MBE1615122.1 VCBS repeat-containing protein [Flavobacterium sp. SaA2.13]
MKKVFTLVSLLLGPIVLMAQQNCQNAQSVEAGTTAVSFSAGSQIPTPICTAGQNNDPDMGAWFAYTPTELYTVTVSTAASGEDTRVHIYSGSCGSLTCVGGDDDSGGAPDYSAIATFTAEAGVTYYIAFDNNWSSTNFSFTLTEAEFVAPAFTQQSVTISGTLSCVADMNGDYLDDIVGVDDGVVHILYQTESGFTPVDVPAQNSVISPSWSIAAGDYNKDGYNDLLYGSGNGAAIMISNNTGTAFSTKLETPDSFLSQRTNFVDINNDGELDAFICDDNAPNVYFLNDGAGGGEFKRSGLDGSPDLGTYVSGGNYASLWTDYDNDGDMDLFIAKCRGANNDAAKDELHRNNGDGTFTNVAQEMDFADYHQAWSSAWGDFDNDGYMDVLVGSNAGLDGSLFSQKLMRNNGDGTFTNITEGSGLDTFNGTSRDYVTHDFNNDGYLDILGGGHYILYNNGDMTFTVADGAPGSGPVGDLNNDGFLDIQNGTLLHLGYDNGNNWLKVHLKGLQSNSNGIGARVEVYTSPDDKMIREIRSGDGFEYMGSLNAHFGLGQTDAIDRVVVKWPSGITDVIENPDINEALMVTEGSFILGRNDVNSNIFSIYPNPVKNVIQFNTDANIAITHAYVYDLSGRLIISQAVTAKSIPVQELSAGTYVLILKDESGRHHAAKIVKE